MKNKIITYIIFMISLFIFNMNISYAGVFVGEITGTGVRLRSGPGTNYEEVKTVSIKDSYTLVNNTIYQTESGCTDGWYKIYYSGADTGYVCSNYIRVSELVYNDTPTNDCETNLKDLGFPSSYWPKLCQLKEAHPNWVFKPIITGIDWATAVDRESACGVSYISSSVETNIDRSCKNPYKNTWYPASSSAVAYYMDPRNWLSEKYIFQFEYLKYDSGLSTLYPDASRSIIKNAQFYQYHLGNGIDLGNVINEACAKDTVNVSPIHISARILQELGNSDSKYNLYSGAYTGDNNIYYNYFNFYNFGVTDSCATSYGTTYCGLNYALKNNWLGLSAAIEGGASQIASSYIAKGQYTLYLQRFNVVPTEQNKIFNHQYMTNVAAPSSEAKTTYNSYAAMGGDILNSAFVFYIPIYNNMDNANYSSSSGAQESETSGTLISSDVGTIIKSSGYKTNGNFMTGIQPYTNVQTVISSLESIVGTGNVIIKNQAGNQVTDSYLGTGYIIEIKTEAGTSSLTALLYGDTSGDGIINALDLLQVQKAILSTYSLEGVYASAGDTSRDGKVNALDLLQIQKYILGIYPIEE